MPDVDTRIDSLKEDIREIGYTVLDLQAKAAAHDSKLEQVLAAEMLHAARFDSVDERLDAHDARFDRIDERFDQVTAQLTEVLARLPQRPE